MTPPEKSEYAEYYYRYIDLLTADDALKVLDEEILETEKLLKLISDEKANYAYAEGKWTIKEIIGHLIDTERIMAYRALSIARGDKTNLPGFEQDDYVKNAGFSKRKLSDLAEEFKILRKSNLALFRSFDAEALQRKGTANNNPVSVRALIYIIAGHEIHHRNVIKEKYLR